MLGPQQVNQWRQMIMGRIDAFRANIAQTCQYMDARGIGVLGDANDLQARWQQIKDLFPDEFNAPRVGDLERHLRFAHRHDFDDILHFDLPEVEAAIARYGRGGDAYVEQQLGERGLGVDLQEIIHPLVSDAALAAFRRRDYRQAIQLGIEIVMDEIRRLGMRDADGDALIRAAIGVQPGRVAFSQCENDNGRGVTEGFKQIAQGLYKGARNPCHHGWDGYGRNECMQILVTCSLLVGRMQIVVPIHQ